MPISSSSNATFEQDVLQSATPVLVDFWAEWCGPCRMMLPVLEQFADAQADKVNVVKINVDENPELAGAFGIMSIPTMIVFKDGQPVHSIVGTTSLSNLNSLAETL